MASVLFLLPGCGDAPVTVVREDPATADEADAEAGDSSEDGGTSEDDQSSPEAEVQAPDTCLPGVYKGRFTCDVSGLIPWNGDLSFELEQEEEGAGGEFAVLRVVPGATIMGMDEYGGAFSGELSGDLDCMSGKFTGMLLHGMYKGSVDANMEGPLSGDYETKSDGASFMGKMGPLTNHDLIGLFLEANCTWSATLQ
ncbi:MAG: hypothetical protein QM778_28150 [Myxococcales bacterium]